MGDLLHFMSAPVLMLVFASVFFGLWAKDRSRRENLALGTAWLCIGIGFLISVLSPAEWGRARVPITHVPYSLAAACFLWGILWRVKIKPPIATALAIALAGVCLMAFTQRVGNNVSTDLFITNISSGIILLLATFHFASAGRTELIERLMLATLILSAAQFFLRPILSLTFDGPIGSADYRETVYYLTLNWTFAIWTVASALVQIACAVKDQTEALRETAARDALSGLLMRGTFEGKVDEALSRASSEGRKLALVIGDIDHFKKINDIWGHQVGDTAIAAFGSMIAGTIRTSDIAGRVGGEEFCILVWGGDETTASGLAERLRTGATALNLGEKPLEFGLSASFGVAERLGNESYHSLFSRADQALYHAKQNGRNRVACAGSLVDGSREFAPSADDEQAAAPQTLRATA